jgi:hypothetical protein
MLGGQRAGTIVDRDGRLLCALTRHIADPNVTLKGRLIEGVAKIDRPKEVVKLLTELAGNAPRIKRDPGLVRYIARGLTDAARGAGEHSAAVEAALRCLNTTFTAYLAAKFPSIRRDIELAEHAVAELGGLPAPPQTPLTVEEFIEGLSNLDPVLPGQFSDWVIVDRYLAKLRSVKGRVNGQLREPIIMAAGRCLWHQHSRCSENAARTLGFIDHPFARGLLLHVLTFESGDGIETEIIQALTRQARFVINGAPERARRFRLALLRALTARHRLVGDQRATELDELLDLFDDASNALVTEQFIELRRFMTSSAPQLTRLRLRPTRRVAAVAPAAG